MTYEAKTYDEQLSPGTRVKLYDRLGGNVGTIVSRTATHALVRWVDGNESEAALSTIRIYQ